MLSSRETSRKNYLLISQYFKIEGFLKSSNFFFVNLLTFLSVLFTLINLFDVQLKKKYLFSG